MTNKQTLEPLSSSNISKNKSELSIQNSISRKEQSNIIRNIWDPSLWETYINWCVCSITPEL
jgi:hypothetical protein